MAISKEGKVGVLGLAVFFTLLFTFNYLNRQNVFSRNLIITAKFDDLEFIKKGNLVLIKGREVGVVTAVYGLNGDLLVDMDIDPATQIPPNAKAVIAELSLLGGRTISIAYEGSCTQGCLENGAVIPGELGNMKTQVAAFAGPMLSKFGTLADSLMGPNGMQNMLDKAHKAAAGLAITTKNLERKMGGMSKTLPGTIKNFKELTASMLKSDSKQLQDAVAGSVDEKTKFALDSLMKNLSSLSQEDIDAMTKILYTLRDQAKTLPEKIEKGKKILAKADNTIDSLNLKLAKFEKGAPGTVPKLLYDEPFKDTLNQKVNKISKKIENIREHPEENLSLKKKK